MTERSLTENAYVRRPAEQVCRLLGAEAARVLQPATESAAREARDVVADLRVDLAGLEIGKAIVIEIGAFTHEGDVARLSLRWRAANQAALFPRMEAELAVFPVAPEPHPLTQLSFVGRYRPPFAVVGAAGDAIVGHRIAEVSVRRFLGEVARRIERELSPLGVGRFLGERNRA